MRARLADAERTILLAEERLHEHNIVDENLAAMLAKVKMHSEVELRRYKEESEISHINSVSGLPPALPQPDPRTCPCCPHHTCLPPGEESEISHINSVSCLTPALPQPDPELVHAVHITLARSIYHINRVGPLSLSKHKLHSVLSGVNFRDIRSRICLMYIR